MIRFNLIGSWSSPDERSDIRDPPRSRSASLMRRLSGVRPAPRPSLLWLRALDNRHHLRYITKISLIERRIPDAICNVERVRCFRAGSQPRAGAASGIIPFGTKAEAWGAATALGQDRTGNARSILRARKHGLELSRDGSPGKSRGRSAGRRARLRQWRAAAQQMSWRRLRTLVCACAAMVGMRLSALRLPLLPEASLFWRSLQAELGRVGVARTVPLACHCERPRSNPVGLRGKLDCFVAVAPRNDELRTSPSPNPGEANRR
jgi:hypothetical protein